MIPDKHLLTEGSENAWDFLLLAGEFIGEEFEQERSRERGNTILKMNDPYELLKGAIVIIRMYLDFRSTDEKDLKEMVEELPVFLSFSKDDEIPDIVELLALSVQGKPSSFYIKLFSRTNPLKAIGVMVGVLTSLMGLYNEDSDTLIEYADFYVFAERTLK